MFSKSMIAVTWERFDRSGEIFPTYFIYNCPEDGRRIFFLDEYFFLSPKMWVKFWSNKQLWISTSAIFRKIEIFQISSSIRSILSLTNDPFFLFQMIQWRSAVITAKSFFLVPSQICYISRISQYLVIENL